MCVVIERSSCELGRLLRRLNRSFVCTIQSFLDIGFSAT